MKSRFARVLVFSALSLTPSLIFAGGQPKLHMPSKSEMQHLSGATRAVQQGKGGGLTRNEAPSNPVASSVRNNDLKTAARQNSDSDSAFRK